MAETKPKPRGRNGKPPQHIPEPNTPDKIKDYSRIQKNCLLFYDMGKVKVKTDEELEQRIAEFFLTCADTGQIPTVEKMCMATGYARQTIFAWESGTSRGLGLSTVDIIKKAKSYLAAFDAELLLENKLNPISYIFRSKNYYGMVDKQEHVLTPNNPLGDGASQEDIQQRLLSGTVDED